MRIGKVELVHYCAKVEECPPRDIPEFALSGRSNVGKSSLINHLIPGLDLRIGSMSRIRQGKHTTTHTQLIPLPGGGHVLDTPGIRNFGLFGVD